MPYTAPPDLADEHGHSVQLPVPPGEWSDHLIRFGGATLQPLAERMVMILEAALRSLPVGVADGENLEHLAEVVQWMVSDVVVRPVSLLIGRVRLTSNEWY